jgi:3-oxoacyl-[acyl-carrier-protein] synthase-3
MVQNRLKGIRISGMASVVPSGVRGVEEEKSLLDMDPMRLNRLKRDIGLNKKHITLKDECASDLCEHAAKYLLSELKYDPSTIDCVVMVTSTPDYFQPATSCVLHGRLGLAENCAAFDINLACSGYVYGLWVSSMMISTGSCHRVLMLAGDTISRCVSPYDRGVAPLFGDAGSATIVENGADDQVITFAFRSDGSGYKHLLIPAGGFRKRPSEETARIVEKEDGNSRSEEHLYMNGAEIFSFTIREIPLIIEEVLRVSNWSKEEVDYFILHQANKFIIGNIARRLKVPLEKAPYNVFEKYGNQSSASIPVTVCENLSSNLRERSMKLVFSVFGSGLSWAACALSLGPMDCYPVIVLEN